MKQRKLAFTEIGKGRLAQQVQQAFEEAQAHTWETRTKTSVILQIAIAPPDANDDRYGKIAFRTAVKKQAIESREYTTLIMDGMIIADGGDPADALQLDLEIENLTQPTETK